MSRFAYSIACSQYGASMGRSESHYLRSDTVARFALQAVPLNAGGYDPGGAYWGTPSDLWRAQADEGQEGYVDMFVRAPSRDAAKAIIGRRYPNARFYR